jgi:hypothetical protein
VNLNLHELTWNRGFYNQTFDSITLKLKLLQSPFRSTEKTKELNMLIMKSTEYLRVEVILSISLFCNHWTLIQEDFLNAFLTFSQNRKLLTFIIIFNI